MKDHIDTAKDAVIFVQQNISTQYTLTGIMFRRFMEQTDYNAEMIKEAFLLSGNSDNEKKIPSSEILSFDACRLFLLASYFLIQYPDEKASLSKEDVSLIQSCEQILICGLQDIYEDRGMPASDIAEIIQAVRTDRVTDEILDLARRRGRISTYYLHFFGGTALLHFRLSNILKNIVKICFAASFHNMFTTAVLVSKSFPADVRKMGGDYDTVFDIDSRSLILEAASRKLDTVLKTQFRKNKTLYLQILENTDRQNASAMMDIIEQENELIFYKRDQIISLIVDKSPVKEEVTKYLRGETDISSLYPYEDRFDTGHGYYITIMRVISLLHSYMEVYRDKSFYNKVASYQLLLGGDHFLCSEILSYNMPDFTKIRRLYHTFEAEHLDMPHLLKFYSLMYRYFYNEKNKKHLDEAAEKVFIEYLAKNREEVLFSFRTSDTVIRAFALKLLGKDAGKNKAEILSYYSDNSKAVKEAFFNILYREKGWEKEILQFLSSNKAAEREIAVRVLAKWNLEKYKPLLEKALEKEKSSKVKTLLQSLLHAETASVLTLQDLVKELHKGGKKRSLAWAYETPFSEVHKKEQGTLRLAEEKYLQAILLCYSSMSPCGISKEASLLAAELDEVEFAVYVNELFDKWLSLGAEAKKRWVLYASSIHGGTEIIKKLQYLITDWAQHSRGALAAEAVRALALNPASEALLIVDSISRKYRFRQVKAAAGEALKYAAKQLGITAEELADCIVPDLGFNEKMERYFDYGPRQFTVAVTTALEIEIFDESGKKLKNLPAPGKKDDPEKSSKSYAAFKEMKKQIKKIVSNQKLRLEHTFFEKRYWSGEAWMRFFVENPIMHQFAVGLIWGVYKGTKLVQTFRYMEDGSFNTEQEEEFLFPQERKISLVHPAELSEQLLLTWKTQLKEYEIIQPVEQLSRPVYFMSDEEAEEKNMFRFAGSVVNRISLSRALTDRGWIHGSPKNTDMPDYYYLEAYDLRYIAELHCSTEDTPRKSGDTTVFDVLFSRKMKDIPVWFFSEAVMHIMRALSGSREKNPDWRSLTSDI